jgi:hypothetical protein
MFNPELLPRPSFFSDHACEIRRIEDLNSLQKLRELNISSNNIVSLDGCQALGSVEVLNASANEVHFDSLFFVSSSLLTDSP